ncbi:MAG: glycosyltransferase, partial [Planctomycetota bacterium]
LVFTMDADLQDDPAEIPRFLEQIDAGRDVVSGWKKVRHDPWHKVGPSRIFNWMVGRFTGVKLHDHNCGFKCYRREIFDEVHLYGELHRFVPVLAAARGWKVGEIVINHRRRQHGKSKYGVSRIARGFLDLLTVWFLTGYGNRPQHLLGSAGLLCFVAGFGGLVWLTIYWVLVQTVWINADLPPLHQRPALVFSMGALLIGAQFMLAGFLAELITARHARDAAPYSIAERAGETPPSGSGDAKP